MVHFGLVVAGMLASAVPAQPVQYYDPGYRPRGYYADLGRRCEAGLPTGYGTRPLICPIVRARPLGRPCVCPAPPRFGGGSYEGRVIP